MRAHRQVTLLEFSVSMKDDLKLPQELKINDVALRAFHQRNDILNSRLCGFKAAGGIRADGSLNWEKGVYRIETSEHIIQSITHVSSEDIVDVSEHVLSITYSLEQNWSDMKACLRRAPLPPVYVHTLFTKGKGPHSIQQFSNKSRALADFAKERLVDHRWGSLWQGGAGHSTGGCLRGFKTEFKQNAPSVHQDRPKPGQTGKFSLEPAPLGGTGGGLF